MDNEIRAVVGYKFTCKNDQCENVNTGFSIYRYWPIGNIDDIMSSNAIQKDLEYVKFLFNCKEKGRKYALIALPNQENIPILGKRIQLFCKKDCIIWERDIVEKSDVLDLYCDICREKLVSAEEAKENGLQCPKCKKDLIIIPWFSQY